MHFFLSLSQDREYEPHEDHLHPGGVHRECCGFPRYKGPSHREPLIKGPRIPTSPLHSPAAQKQGEMIVELFFN